MICRAILVALFSLVALPLWADSTTPTEEAELPVIVRLTPEQMGTVFFGNTIKGSWDGKPFMQFFSRRGDTYFVTEDGNMEQGNWRINAFTGRFEIWWEQTGWVSYRVIMTNQGFAWSNRSLPEPFTVMEGQQVEW